MEADTILWRRLDGEGHDACRLLADDEGWRLEGAAIYSHEGRPACLAYQLEVDRGWRTRRGSVRGWVGDRTLDLRVERTASGVWTLNGEREPDVEGCVDLDLGFTPATNLSQIRRVALQVGQSAEVPVAWLDVPLGNLERLPQRYERRAPDLYWYESSRFGYAALLRVDAAGFVVTYPGLWAAV